MKKFKQCLPIKKERLKSLLQITETLNNEGNECFLIGGSVRDLILGKDVYDYDFATNAKPETVIKLFKKVIPTGMKHGTVTIILDKNNYEVTTYRADGKYIDGRRPESVSFSDSLGEDVQRRDFTINGLAYDIKNETIIDYVHGIEDLNKKIIRTIGDPLQRFSEDGLRTYRACRFSSALNFEIEENTFKAIGKSLEVADKISVERIRDELTKLLQSEKPSIGLENLRLSGLLNLFLPELAHCHDVSQNRFHMYDIYYHSVYSCDAAPKDKPAIRLSALLHDIGKLPTRSPGPTGDFTFYNHEIVGAKLVRRIMKRLKYSNDMIDRVNNLITNHMFHYTDKWTDGAVRRFIRKVGLENINDLISLRIADRKGNGARFGIPAPIGELMKKVDQVIEEDNAFSIRDLHINGTIIMDVFKLKPGPIIGNILHELLDLVLDEPELNEQGILLDKVSEILQQQAIKNS